MAGCFLWSFLFASPKSDLCLECSFEDVCCIRGDFSYTDSLVEYSVVLLSLLWNVFRRGPQKCRMCAFDGFFYAAVLLFKVLCSMILAGPAGRELLSNGLMFVMAVCVWCDLGKLCRCTRTANNTPASIKEDIVDDLY